VLLQDRCTACAKCTLGTEIVLDAPDGTPTFEAQEEAHFSPFRDSTNPDAKQVHGLGQMSHGLGNHFGCSGGTPR
jgi:hypothetical protein